MRWLMALVVAASAQAGWGAAATMPAAKPEGEAVRALVKKVEGAPKDVGLRVELARARAAAGDGVGAVREYDIATSLDPKGDRVWAEWGALLMAMGQPARAEEKFRKALNVKGAEAVYHVALGRALREQGKVGSAMNAFEQAKDLDEKCAEAFFEAGQTLIVADKEAEGEANLRAALHLKPEWVEAQVALAKLLITGKELERRNLLEGTTLLQKAVAGTGEKDLGLLVTYGDALGKAGLPEQALEVMQRAVVLAKAVKLPGEQLELLLGRVQGLEVKLAGPMESGSSRVTLIGTPWEYEPDEPLPEPEQLRVEDLLKVRMDMTKPLEFPIGPKKAEREQAERGLLR